MQLNDHRDSAFHLVRRLRALAELGRDLAAADSLSAVAAVLCTASVAALHAAAATLHLVERSGNIRSFAPDDDAPRTPSAASMPQIQRALRSAEPFVAHDVPGHSALFVPLLDGFEVPAAKNVD